MQPDDELMAAARLATGKAVLEAGLRPSVQLKAQGEILQLAGKVTWTGNLEVSRMGRHSD